MDAPPWASDPVVSDYEHGGFNQQAPADAPAAAASIPASGAAQAPAAATGAAPWANDPVATAQHDNFSAANPAQLVDTRTTGHAFGDDAVPRETSARLSPEDEAHLYDILRTHPAETAASEARRFVVSRGVGNAGDNFDDVIANRHLGINQDHQYKTVAGPPSGAGAAFVRGAGEDIPFYAKAASALDALGLAPDGRPTMWDKDSRGFVDAYHHNLDINHGILDADEANHPTARLTGELLGGLLIPTGMEGVGFTAGKAALRAGATMREARAVAATAVRNRAAVSGATYGGLHGAGESDGSLGDMALKGTMGAVEGGAGGYGVTAAGQAIGEHVAPALAALRPAEAASEEAAPNYRQMAQDINVDRTPATASRTGIATAIQTGLGASPGGAPVIGAAVNKEIQGLADEARRVAAGIGPVSTKQGAGEAIAQGAAEYRTTSKKEVKGFYNERDRLFGGTEIPVPTPQAAAKIADFAAQYPTSEALADLRTPTVMRKLEGILPGKPQEEPTGLLDASGNPITRTVPPTPLTLGETTDALSYVRGVLRRMDTPGADKKMLAHVGELKDALARDVSEAGRQADLAAGRNPGEEGSAVAAQQKADQFYADRANALSGALKRPLDSAADDTRVSGESVYNQMLKDMDAKTGNLQRLRDTWFKRLPESAKKTFGATSLDDLGRASSGAQNDTGDAWSFNNLLTNRDKFSEQARNIVWGKEANDQIDKIAAYGSRLRDLGKSRNFSNTAQTYLAGAYMATLFKHIASGEPLQALKDAAIMPLAYGGAKIFVATPKMRDWTISAMKAATGAAQGNTSDTAFKVLTQRLSSIAASEPAIADQVLGLKQYILSAANDNLGHAAAASQANKQQGGDKR